MLFSFSEMFFALAPTIKSFLLSKSTSTQNAAGNRFMLAGSELLGKLVVSETIKELLLGAVPPFIKRFKFGYATSPSIKSKTPELLISKAKTVEPACFGVCSVGLIVPSIIGYSAPGMFPVVHSTEGSLR